MAEYTTVKLECPAQSIVNTQNNVIEFYEHIEYWCSQNNIEAYAMLTTDDRVVFRVNRLHEAIFKLKWS